MSDPAFDRTKQLSAKASSDPRGVLRFVAERVDEAEGTELVGLLLAAGLAHQTLLQPTDALRVLQRAKRELVDRVDDPQLLWALKAEMAGTLIDLGRPEEARAELEAAERPEWNGLQMLEPKTAGRVHHILGLSHQRIGASKPAIEHYQRAIEHYQDDDALLGLGHVFTNLAILATHEGRVDEAVGLLDQADSAFDRLGNEVWAAITVLNRAWVVGCGGHLPRSLQLFTEAEDLLQKLDMPDGLRVVSKAEVLIRAGLFAAAQIELEQAVSQFEDQGLGIERSQALILASHAAELAGDTEAATKLAASAIQEMDSQSRPGWAATARAVAFTINCRAGDPPNNLDETVESLAEFVASAGHDRLVPMIQLSAAWAFLDQGRPDAARRFVEQARSGPESTESKSFFVVVQARLFELDDLPGRALQTLDEGYLQLESDLRILGGIDIAAMAAGAVAQIVAMAKRLLAGSQDSDAFLRWSDRSRQITTWRWPRLESPELTTLLNQARALTPRGGVEPDLDTQHKLDKIKSRIRELRWHQQIPERGHGRAATPPPGRREVGADQYRLVDLTMADGEWMVTVADSLANGERRAVEHRRAAGLNPAGLMAAIRLGRIFQTAPRSMQAQLVDQIVASLTPLEETLRPHLPGDASTSLLISIDDELADLPWPAIPCLWERSFSLLPTQRYLGDRSERLSTKSGVSLLVGPGLATAGAEAGTNLPTPQPSEAGSAAGPIAPQSFDQLTDALDRRIVHIAAHGGPEPDNPLFNWLEFDFGRVFLHDLMFLDVVPEIVVLAACYAGQSQRFGVGGTASFANGFLGVGSRWVISACSALVDDEPLVEFASEVLRRIVEGTSPPAALALTRASINPRRSHPSALSFTCYGG